MHKCIEKEKSIKGKKLITLIFDNIGLICLTLTKCVYNESYRAILVISLASFCGTFANNASPDQTNATKHGV